MPGFKTILNVINASSVGEEEENPDAEITITLRDAEGEIVGEPLKTTLAPNAQIKGDLKEIFQEHPAVDNVSGWLEVESSRDRIIGTVSFTNENGDFLSVIALSGKPEREFLFPVVAKDANYHTGMAFLNNNPDPAEITIEVWGIGGTLDQSAAITLDSGNRTAIYLSELLPNMPDQIKGHIRIRSDQPLHSFSIINDGSFGFVLTLPPIALSPDQQ
jgi:hypothetical protein